MGFAKVFFVVFSLIQLYIAVDAANDCTKWPAEFKPMTCCQFPKIVPAEAEKMKKTIQDLSPEKPTDYTTECKITEGLFKELKFIKDGDFAEEDFLKYADSIIEDAEWKPVLQAAVKECNKRITAKLADVQKKMEAAPYNVKKDQCNVKFGSIIMCIKTEAFIKCPKGKWSEDKNCPAAKNWVEECGKSFDSIMDFYSKKA